MKELTIPGYTIKRKLGEGGSRIAYLAKRAYLDTDVVIKVFKKRQLHPRIKDQRGRHELEEIVASEVATLRKLSHPNIIRYFNHGFTRGTFFIEEEYMEGDTALANLQRIDTSTAALLFLQMLNGVTYVHGNGILLRDIKLNNMLLTKDLTHLKIDDLELCGRLGQLVSGINVTRGSEKYSAPELVKSTASERTDVYALGCCFLYLITKQHGRIARINQLAEEEYNQGLGALLEPILRPYRLIIERCLAFNPEGLFAC